VTASSRYTWLRGISVSFALVAASCGGGGDDSSGAPVAQPVTAPIVARPTDLTDLQIAQLVYSGSPRTPDGFYSESPPPSYAYVATSQLKNTDVATVPDDAAQFELCTDDWNEALAWSEAAQQRAPEYANLTETSETERYFEFGRVRDSEPEFYLRGRVFKCSYLDRAVNNLRASEGTAGVLKSTPVAADALKHLSEYLWQFTRYNNFGHAVLSSDEVLSSTRGEHTLLIASMTRQGMSATCDLIDVEAWRHHVDVNTGALTREIETLWSFGAREANGAGEECD
jgi:hypothetical protein